MRFLEPRNVFLLMLFIVKFVWTAKIIPKQQDATEYNVVGTCGGVYKDQLTGYIASPGYPNTPYPPDQNCTYYVYAPPGHVIAFESVFMDVENPDNIMGLCLYDFLKLFDSDVMMGENGIGQSYCGESAIYPNATESNVFRVEFISDYSKSGTGFLLEWKIINPKEQEDQFDCTFDGFVAMCPGWKSEPMNGFEWSIKRGKTPSSQTGPDIDHTTKSEKGRYAFVEASLIEENTTTLLISPRVRAKTTECCLDMWCHMYGEGMGSLEIRKVDSAGYETIINIRGDQGDKWFNKKMNIQVKDKNTKIWFMATRGSSYRSDLAIDDVKISEGRCKQPKHPRKLKPEVQPECAGNTVFRDCATACNHTCKDGPLPPPCETTCIRRCACPYYAPIWHIDRCVPYDVCPTLEPPTKEGPKDEIHDFLYSTILDLLKVIFPKGTA